MTADEPPQTLAHALGRLVGRASYLERVIGAWIDGELEQKGHASGNWCGRSGKPVTKKLNQLGRTAWADDYHHLSQYRNHLVHGTGMDLPGIGYHVVPVAPDGASSERLWQLSEIDDVSAQMGDLLRDVRTEIDGAEMTIPGDSVTGPIAHPWRPVPQ